MSMTSGWFCEECQWHLSTQKFFAGWFLWWMSMTSLQVDFVKCDILHKEKSVKGRFVMNVNDVRLILWNATDIRHKEKTFKGRFVMNVNDVRVILRGMPMTHPSPKKTFEGRFVMNVNDVRVILWGMPMTSVTKKTCEGRFVMNVNDV